MEPAEGTRIRIVPHFMRLHEWIALDEGYHEAEGEPGRGNCGSWGGDS